MITREIHDVTIADPGDFFPESLPVEAIRAYSVGRLPDFVAAGLKIDPRTEVKDDGRRVRVAQVKVNGVWVDL